MFKIGTESPPGRSADAAFSAITAFNSAAEAPGILDDVQHRGGDGGSCAEFTQQQDGTDPIAASQERDDERIRTVLDKTSRNSPKSRIAASVLPRYSSATAFHRMQFWYRGSISRQRSKSAEARQGRIHPADAAPQKGRAVVRVGLDRTIEQFKVADMVNRPGLLLRARQRGVRHRQRRVELQRLRCCSLGQCRVVPVLHARLGGDGRVRASASHARSRDPSGSLARTAACSLAIPCVR